MSDLIPEKYRKPHGKDYFNKHIGQMDRFEDAWMSHDEFVLDPTRLTLFTGKVVHPLRVPAPWSQPTGIEALPGAAVCHFSWGKTTNQKT